MSAENLRTRVTYIFVEGNELLASDSGFGVKESLVKNFEEESADSPMPDGRELDVGWSRVRFEIVLAPTDV